ncbi:MAG: DUF1631 family protein [Polaromonas sp.]|uniref:DUF1631 family protein n=1 Tax=Polaromonas sp. TaxID=1869339 RepID=UPI004035255F
MSNAVHGSFHSLLSGHPLFAGLSGGTQADPAAGDQSEFSYTVPAALDLLAEMQESGTLAQHAADSQADSAAELPMVQLRAQLKAVSRSRGQALAIDVVALLMEQMAQDSRLLPGVRQAIAGAEPAYLDLALSDPRFFSARNHPARRLLDVVTARSQAFSHEQTPAYADFLQDLRQSLAFLLEGAPVCDAAHFARTLAWFEQQQARRLAADPAHGRAVQALLRAEERNLLADQLSAELRARPEFGTLNFVIADFLTGPWAQVMAQEKLAQAASGLPADKPPFSGLLRDLFWSLDPEPSAQHRKRLLRVIPRMLASLREGLLFIDYPLAQSKPFFDELMAIHQQALKQAFRHVPEPAAFPEAPAARHSPDFLPSKPWLAPAEVRHSGFLDMDVPAEGEQAAAPAPAPAGAGCPDLVAQLTLGTWVELVRDGTVLRAQLTWASPHHTLFMFSSAGGRTHSMTRRALLRLQQLGALQVVSTGGVVEHAFDKAARQAMQAPGRPD